MKVRKAVIPAAGFGTRFLPATKAMPKEMLPIVDKPTIQYIVEEAVEAGIEDIIIVTGQGKRAIEDHFDSSFHLEYVLNKHGKHDLLQEVRQSAQIIEVHYIRQKAPLGLGHAIWCARKFIGNEPFAVLLGDTIVPSKCMRDMLSFYEQYENPVIGVAPVKPSELSKYGIVETTTEGCYSTITRLVEKPNKGETSSNLAIFGRYILSHEIFSLLEKLQPGKGGEIQLTDAINEFRERKQTYAYTYDGPFYDIGEKIGFIQATILFALQREELKDDVLKFVNSLIINSSDKERGGGL